MLHLLKLNGNGGPKQQTFNKLNIENTTQQKLNLKRPLFRVLFSFKSKIILVRENYSHMITKFYFAGLSRALNFKAIQTPNSHQILHPEFPEVKT